MHYSCTARPLLLESFSRITITNLTWYVQVYTSIWYVHTWFVLVCTLFTSTIHFLSGPINLARLASLCFAHNLFLLSSILVPHQGRVLVYTCIYHVYTMYRQLIYIFKLSCLMLWYRHVYTWHIHSLSCIYTVTTCIYMYIPCTDSSYTFSSIPAWFESCNYTFFDCVKNM